MSPHPEAPLQIGWSAADLTPSRPVLIAGQFHARVSEGVADPITATVLALESGGVEAVLVSCDLVGISDELRDAVRAQAGALLPGLDPAGIVLNATHTHTAPEIREPTLGSGHTAHGAGVDLDVQPPGEYVAWAAGRLAAAVAEAVRGRAPARVAFGLGHAVIGRNRRWVDTAGHATMYGVTDTPQFAHIEGYEDHHVNLMATADGDGALTGLVVNVACPSQVSESDFRLSADYWYETRLELRRRFGADLHILAQCSAAGDQSPHVIVGRPAEERMLALKGRTRRQEIAVRLADAAAEVLPHIQPGAAAAPRLRRHFEVVDLPLARLDEAAVAAAQEEAAALKATYEQEVEKLRQEPARRAEPRWYVPASRAYRRMRWLAGVTERCAAQQAGASQPAEIHVLRLGDMALATNPFEYYLDYGTYIRARSPAVQTFLVQLAGGGTYVPSPRSVAGGGYGSIPASNPVGPEGGRRLAERTVEVLRQLFEVAP